jgi:hypothetical protein
MAAKHGHSREENSGKVYHAKKSLLLLDVLRGGTRVDWGGVFRSRDRPAAEIMCPRSSKVGTA